MPRYEIEAGRGIVRDGIRIATIQGVTNKDASQLDGMYTIGGPAALDEWTRELVSTLNSHDALVKTLKIVNMVGMARKRDPWLIVSELVAALNEAKHVIAEYHAYGEAMREHGRGFQPTGTIGHSIEGVQQIIDAALKLAGEE